VAAWRSPAGSERALHVPYVLAAILQSMATMRDLRAAEARETTAEAASVVSGINRITQQMAEAWGINRITQHMAEAAGINRITQHMAEAAGINRITQHMAEIVGIQRITQHMAEAVGSQMTATLLAPKLREFSRQAELLAEQLGNPVQPVDGDLDGSEALTRTPNVDWLLLSQLTIRATILAFFLALVVAVWEEQADTAPAQSLLEIIGALVVWYQIDDAVWKKIS
jgi:hypothetical protein